MIFGGKFMLDDLKYINQTDKVDALGIAGNEPKQLTYDFALTVDYSGIENVVYAAMGGSALAASLSQTWPGYKVPCEIVRSYNLPDYVSSKTLCIVASNSGNTEETLSALAEAEAKKAKIVVIAGGGKLKEIAETKGYPLALLPDAKQPRYGVFYNLKALVEIGKQTNIFAQTDLSLLELAVPFLQEKVKGWQPIVSVRDNLAKQIALDCLGKSVVIYAGPKLAPAAYKWKISFNENAKHIAWYGIYSEFNHNEFIGWSQQPIDKPYCIIDLRSDLEHPRIQKRFALSARLLSGKRPEALVVQVEGNNIVEQLLYAVLLGDFTTLYTAIANGIDPAPVDLVEKFKRILND
jgi:glucose/mannose-6-phosphate isomerase